MGSLKFATGLSLLSYESCRPNAFAFLSSFPLAFQAVSLKRSPFQFQPTLLASSLAGSIEPGFKVSPICLIVLERLSFGRTCAFSVPFESGDLGTFAPVRMLILQQDYYLARVINSWILLRRVLYIIGSYHMLNLWPITFLYFKEEKTT